MEHAVVAPDMQYSSDNTVFTKQLEQELASQPHGHFYRYVGIDKLRRLMTEGTLSFNPQTGYQRIVSEQFNPSHASDENIVGLYTSRLLYRYFDGPKERDLETLPKGKVMPYMQKLEERLVSIDPKYRGLVSAFGTTIATKDTSALIAYFKQIGGEEIMIAFQKAGWGADPEAAFSDLFSISVGAPLYFSGAEDVVVVELDFSPEELSIPGFDNLNEHEVMVRSIRRNNVRKIYTHDQNEQLFAYLQTVYPQYMNPREDDYYGVTNPLMRFAQEKPLAELLEELDIKK